MSSGFSFDAPEDTGGSGKFLDQPGTYHMAVMSVQDGVKSNGEPITGGGFTVHFSVLAGTVNGQEEREVSITLFNGKLTDKDQGEFSRKKQAAFLIATDLLNPNQLGSKGLSINLEAAQGRQIVATLEPTKDAKGNPTKFLTFSGANIYHIDDPRAANFPKDAKALAILPKALRHDAAYFAKLLEKRPASSSAPVRQQQLTASQLADL